MTWILTLLSSFWKPIAAIGGGLIVFFFQRWRIKRKDALIERQDDVIKMHEAKEQIHEQDKTIESEANKQIQVIREKVDHAETPEQAAGVVAEELNRFFASGEDK